MNDVITFTDNEVMHFCINVVTTLLGHIDVYYWGVGRVGRYHIYWNSVIIMETRHESFF